MNGVYMPPKWTVWINVLCAGVMFGEAAGYWRSSGFVLWVPIFLVMGILIALVGYHNYKRRKNAMVDAVYYYALMSDERASPRT